MTDTPILGIPEAAEATAVPWEVVNYMVRVLEAGTSYFTVLDRDLTTPPGSPAEGSRYIVATGGSGAWSGLDGRIVVCIGGAWFDIIPLEGFRAYVQDENVVIEYSGSAWGVSSGAFTAASTTEVLTGTDNAKGATPDSVAALWEQGSNVASAATISLGEGGYFNITGTTTITDIDFATDKAGRKVWVKFAGVLTLTHNASTLILPTGASITTAAGDTACFISEGSDVVRCIAYQRANGQPLSASGGAASATQDDEMIAGFIAAPSDKSYTIVLKMAHAGTITETTTKSVSGTCTATFKINSTALGGTANSVSSTEQSQAHASSNTFSAGDDVVLTVSSNSSCADMSFSIKYTRTLD